MENKYKKILSTSTILLVEDNTKLRKMFKDILSVFVDTVYEASNGEEAIEIFKKVNPNIVMTDMEMPVMNGLILTQILRKLDINIPIVIISGYDEKKLLLDFISLNLVDYLVKPIDFDQLEIVLNRCAKIMLDKGLIEIELTKDCLYSYSKKSLIIKDEIIALTVKEINFLELLIKNKNKLVSKSEVECFVYNKNMTTSAINNLVLRLRKKINIPKVILTINELGFMFVKQ